MKQWTHTRPHVLKESKNSQTRPVRLRYRGIAFTSDHDQVSAIAPRANNIQQSIMGKTAASDVLASCHTISTEAKSFHKQSQRFNQQENENSVKQLKVSTRFCRRYSINDIQKITERMVTPPTKPSCKRRTQATDQLTMIERFGVPPHLWGRQKPADENLIRRLVRPTTSHSQRCALTLQQYKQRAS